MSNGRCRLHGGKSQGAPHGDRNGNFRHGAWTKASQAERRRLRALLRELHGLARGAKAGEAHAPERPSAAQGASLPTAHVLTETGVRRDVDDLHGRNGASRSATTTRPPTTAGNREDARQVAENVGGFFAILAERSRAEVLAPANDAAPLAKPIDSEVRHER